MAALYLSWLSNQANCLPCPGRNSYLLNQPTWANCQEPEHIVLWNVVLFSILLGIGVVEAVLCLSQVVSGLCDIFCGTCVRKGQVGAARTQECSSHFP